ncbi:MAG: SGNH/GDSL hydrolase family protein [Alphaproteobacteria bacterium]|nr:SGNH/GDSL hydrolase family protein [Alphaproteobacteria bacterium]
MFTPLVILALLSLLLAVVATETVLYSRNTPAHHPEWVLSKTLVSGPLMGDWESVTTRNVLHRNRLRLNEWHGFQEILLDKVTALGSLHARFMLGAGGYLTAIFNKDAAGYAGVRVSRNPLFPNLFFRASDKGEFIETLPLGDIQIHDGWHDLDLRFDSGRLQVSVNDEVIGEIAVTSRGEQVVGLRSGLHLASIDNVEVRAADGTLLIAEDFRNDRGYWATLFALFAAAFLTVTAIYVASRRRGRDGKPTLYSLILIEAFLTVVFLLYFLFDYYHYSEFYYVRKNPDWKVIPESTTQLEVARQYIFTELPFVDLEKRDLLSRWPGRLIQFLEADPDDNESHSWLKVARGPVGRQELDPIDDSQEGVEAYLGRKPLDISTRILLLGTSQTWGVGGGARNERMAPMLQRALSGQLGPDHEVAIINASRWGSRSGPLLDRYRSHLHLFRPDIVIVNLSNNDATEGFAEKLTEMVEFGRNIGAETLFVLEANSSEAGDRLSVRHEIMRNVASANDVPVADLHGIMNDPEVYDTGIIWWDRIHMTSYGQRLAAEFIGHAVLENFKLGDETPPSAAPSGTGD